MTAADVPSADLGWSDKARRHSRGIRDDAYVSKGAPASCAGVKGVPDVRRKTFAEADCPVARSLDQVGDWWSLLIVRDALDGVRRFGEFHRSLGLAKNVLATRLNTLVDHGILQTQPASDGSSYQEYVLTEKGESLRLVLAALRQWGQDHLFTADEHPPPLVDRTTGEPIARLKLTNQDGQELHPRQVGVSWTDRS